MVTTTLKVRDIDCASCEDTIRTALSRLPGVETVVPSGETNEVKVGYDEGATTEEAVRERLRDIGFEPLG